VGEIKRMGEVVNEKAPAVLMGQAIKAQVSEHRRKGKRKPKVLALEYFVAGVPPLPLLEINLEELGNILNGQKQEARGTNPAAELCFIGIAAYFEAFCKDSFAAIANICPELLEEFVTHRDCAFTLAEVLHLTDGSKHRIGSLLAEHYDWGSAQTVNSLFHDLLKVSPFSKDEARRYAEFLNDRNLLVHHGGIYTFKYAGQKFDGKKIKAMVHWDSLAVSKQAVLKWIEFFLDIARKTSAATQKALENFVHTNNVKLDRQRERASKLLVL
jgi:hypothetical protein